MAIFGQFISNFLKLLKFIIKFIDKLLRQILLLFIKLTRPLLGPAHCRYPITCTEYAKEVLNEKNFILSVFLITKRVLLCNPFIKPRL